MGFRVKRKVNRVLSSCVFLGVGYTLALQNYGEYIPTNRNYTIFDYPINIDSIHMHLPNLNLKHQAMQRCYSTYWLIMYASFCLATAHLWGIVQETDDTDKDDDDVEAGPATDEVIEPDIKTSNPTDLADNEEVLDPSWDMNRVIRDVAYFLRTHKFKDFDHRYYGSVSDVPKRLYQEFPKPPLRALHWEVHKNCEVSFKSCLQFLERVVKLTPLKRQDDTVTVMREQSWDHEKDKQQIVATQVDCEVAKKKDNLTADPFQGPIGRYITLYPGVVEIERFQWRTTASYYMCWYTMLGIPELALFGEPCDNMAYCLDHYGMNNKDPRADDNKPFACAMYSFCPDPCCPLEHIWYMNDCYQSPENPCYAGNSPDSRECVMNRENNRDFTSIIKSQLNVTCVCQEPGYEWSSRFGICVDIDECGTKSDNCSTENLTTCINLPGYYDCICSLGYIYSPEEKKCVVGKAMIEALQGVDSKKSNGAEAKSILAIIVKIITRSKASNFNSNALTLFTLYTTVSYY